MATQYEINDAYYQGLRELGPDAEHDAIEFGIPYGEPVRDAHVRAGQEVASIMAAHDSSVETPHTDDERQRWINSFHLTGPIPPKTPEERAAAAENMRAVRGEIRPLKSRSE